MALRYPIDRPVRPDAAAVARAYGHRLRGRVLTAFSEQPGSTIREAADRLGESPRRVRHHLGPLLDAGLVEVVGEEIHGRVVRRRYAAGSTEVDYDGSLSDEERMEVAKAVIRLLMEDIRVAAAAGTLGRKSDEYEMRMYGEVDHAGLEELVDRYWRAYRDISRAIREGSARVRESGRPGTEVISALFFFQAPLWGERVPRRPGEGCGRPRPGLRDPEDPAARAVEALSTYPDPQTLSKAYDHPVRARVLTALSERPDSTIREVAERIDESPRRVRHHVEGLLEAGLVAVTDSENLSGVIQRRFGAGLLVVDDATTWSREERVRFSRTTIGLLASDLGLGVEAGTIGKGADDFEIRMYGEVDDACREELAELHMRADRGIRRAIEEARERVSRSGEPGVEIVSAVFFFEVPLWGRAKAGPPAGSRFAGARGSLPPSPSRTDPDRGGRAP